MARQSLYSYKRDGILQAIETLSRAHGRAPSLREIAEVADVSVATLHSYLRRMQAEGVVTWAEKHHRSLRVVKDLSPPLPVGTSNLPGTAAAQFVPSLSQL